MSRYRQVLSNYFVRRDILKIPDEILENHEDKHFVWLNANTLQKNGMYNEHGLKVFIDPSAEKQEGRFNDAIDGSVRRNEMVLTYMPKEQYEALQEEQAMVKELRSLTDIFTKNPALSEFQVQVDHASETEVIE